MRILINYSSHGLKMAETVYGEMVRAGAEAFQFPRSAIIGQPSWEQVLDWISESDAFIVLISKDARKSKPVKEEIGQAHYSYIKPTQQASHLDLILSELSGGPRTSKPPGALKDYNKWFLGYDRRIDTVDTHAGGVAAHLEAFRERPREHFTFYIDGRRLVRPGPGRTTASRQRVEATGTTATGATSSGGRARADEEACATLRSTERRQPWALEEETCRNVTRRRDAIS